MTEEIIKILAQGGVAITTLIALYFVLQAISAFMGKNGNKKNNNEIIKINNKLSKLENNDMHYLRERIDKTDRRIDKIEQRLTKIETILDIKK